MANLEGAEIVPGYAIAGWRPNSLARVKNQAVPRWIGVYLANGGKAAIKTVGGLSQQVLEFGPDAQLTPAQIDEVVVAVAALVTANGPFYAGQELSNGNQAAAAKELADWRQNPDFGLDMNHYRRVNDTCEEASRRGLPLVDAIVREFTIGKRPLPHSTARRYFRTAKAVGFPCGELDHNDAWKRDLAERWTSRLTDGRSRD